MTRRPRQRLRSWLRSVRVQGFVLGVILILLPVLIFAVLANADAERRQLILAAVEETGDAVAAGLAPMLRDLRPAEIDSLQRQLARFGALDRSIKILLRPALDTANPEFYLIATEPAISAEERDAERQQLLDLGILPALSPGCDAKFLRGRDASMLDNGAQVLTSVASVQGVAGCWAIVIATSERRVLGAVEARPYWTRPEVRFAIGIYVLMAALIAAMFAGIWRDLLRFRRVALSSSEQPRFARLTDTPELAPMATAFDAMVQRMRRGAEMLRQAAEDNAHAFKGPISTIRIAIEQVGRRDGGSSLRLPMNTVGTISTALDRLDGLVRSARDLDTAAAELLEPQYARLDLTALVRTFVQSYAAMSVDRKVGLEARADDGITILAQPDIVETILETLVDNAIGFSPEKGRVLVQLKTERANAVLTVEDEGPGVPAERLARIFERYYTDRTNGRQPCGSAQHFGIGLWLARQNALSLGGRIEAANRQPHGLCVTVVLPLARGDAR
jgi:two-component system sensor histidine kinase ChvG